VQIPKDQNEALKSFGEIFPSKMYNDFTIYQTRRIFRSTRRQDELFENPLSLRLEKSEKTVDENSKTSDG